MVKRAHPDWPISIMLMSVGSCNLVQALCPGLELKANTNGTCLFRQERSIYYSTQEKEENQLIVKLPCNINQTSKGREGISIFKTLKETLYERSVGSN